MRLLGFQIPFTKAPVGVTDVSALSGLGRWLGRVQEPFTGAWQRNMEIDSRPTLLTFSAVYACISIIAQDIAKLRVKPLRLTKDGIWAEATEPSPKFPVLRKPNRYQTHVQFFEYWITMRLLHGNSYILKERDNREVVTALHVLDPTRVVVKVAPDGSVFYALAVDSLAGLGESAVVPASEIIHDRALTAFHPLIGISPLFAAGRAATQGNRIQNDSAMFFENMSRPGGMLTAPEMIDDVTANRLKAEFERNFSGANIGRLLVAGDGLKYAPMTIPAKEAQLIEQLKWTVEDVARAFRVPMWKLQSGTPPSYGNGETLNRAYYSETLQNIIEAIEVLLDEGLEMPSHLSCEFDLDPLLRMDTAARYEAHTQGVTGGWLAPNEARRQENLPPVEGGDSPLAQQQNYSLAALSKRDEQPDPFATARPAAPALPAPSDDESDDDDTEETARMLALILEKELRDAHYA